MEASNGGKTLRKAPEKRGSENLSNFYFDVKAIFREPGALKRDNTAFML